MDSIIVALITGGLSLVGVVITCSASNRKTESNLNNALDKNLAVTETKLNELTREVRKHNNFAERMPVVEEQIKVINHRLEDLENEHKRA